MTIVSLTEFVKLCKGNGPLLGIDTGEKNIGIAVSDRLWNVATPCSTLQHNSFKTSARSILEIYNARQAAGIVVGLPLNMDGSKGPRAQSAQSFAHNLSHMIQVPLCLWDERLSTTAVQRTMIEADLSRMRQKQVVDKMAAAYILQGVLDYARHCPLNP